MKSSVYKRVFLAGVLGTALSVSAQPPGHIAFPGQRDQKLYVSCRVEAEAGPIEVETALELSSPAEAATLNLAIDLPAPLAPLHVTRYLPKATREQTFVPVEGDRASPGIKISIDGPSQSVRQWLVGDNVERNRLISLIGTWRYMVVADRAEREELFAQFRDELTRDPTLVVSKVGGGGSHSIPVRPGTNRMLEALGCRILVQSYNPDFAVDPETGRPVNLSDERRNPAALVEVEHNGVKERRWVFAKYPGFRADATERLPFKITLDCPPNKRSDTPGFALVSVGRARHELWTHEETRHISRPIALNEEIAVPESRYTFHITQFIPSGRLVEKYSPAEGKRGLAVLEIETTDAAGDRTVFWLEKGKRRVLATAIGPMTVAFGSKRATAMGGQKWPH